jgi:hypothetical protein
MMATKDPDQFPEQAPNSVIKEAKAAFERKAPGDLAVLVHDSLIDQDDPAADHRLRFEHPRVFIELQVSAVGGTSRVTGRVSPPAPVQVQLETGRGELPPTTEIDDGVFTFHEISRGTVRILLSATDNFPAIHTDWFRI